MISHISTVTTQGRATGEVGGRVGTDGTGNHLDADGLRVERVDDLSVTHHPGALEWAQEVVVRTMLALEPAADPRRTG